MATRIQPEPKALIVIAKDDFEEDYKRGYCVLEFNPARVERIKDPRSNRVIERTYPADLMLRCMDCKFDALDGVISTKPDGTVITGQELMRQHRFHGEHPWKYDMFSNPYGYTSDVMIEGVEVYQEHLDQAKES